jgi:hypothetical protein
MIKRLFFAALAIVIFSRTYGEPKSYREVNRLHQINSMQSGFTMEKNEGIQQLKKKAPSSRNVEMQ